MLQTKQEGHLCHACHTAREFKKKRKEKKRKEKKRKEKKRKEKDSYLHHARHKDVVLEGVGVAIWRVIEGLEHVVMPIANVLPLVHWLRHNLHKTSAFAD